MKVLTISSERSEITPDSRVAERLIQYGDIADRYDVVLTGKKPGRLDLSERVRVYSTGEGNTVTRLLKLVSRARKVLAEDAYDIVSTKDPYYLGFVTWFLAHLAGAAFQVQIHGFEKLYPHRRILARFVLRRADGVRAVSERLKRQLIDEFSVDPRRITVVPIHVDVSSISKKARALGPQIPSSTFRFLTVGRLVPIKNITLQLKALAALSQRYPNAHLTVAGEGPLRSKLENFAARAGIASMVTFSGRTRDLAALFHDADCFVLSSWREGYGMAPIEAAAAGVPIIMTDVGCAGEVIRDGENGIVVPVGDAQKLAEAMARIMDDDAFRARAASHNEDIGKRLLSLSATLEEYRRAWEAAAATHRGAV